MANWIEFMNFFESPTLPLDERVEGLYPESLNPTLEFQDGIGDGRIMSIPHGADTTYLSHGYFRYIGKYPPQVVAYILNKYDVKGPILDPMVGGGTTLTEARLRGIDAVGCDINPIPRLVSQNVSTPVDPVRLACEAETFINKLKERVTGDSLKNGRNIEPLRMNYCADYFEDETLLDLAVFNELTSSGWEFVDFYRMALFSILRKISRANIKKMNLEIDKRRVSIPRLVPTFEKAMRLLVEMNREFALWASQSDIKVIEASAEETGLEAERFGAVFLHPPYLTNTAFSEFTQLQLALLGIDHKKIWKKELRCRGSFLHESNGLKKYVVGWKRIMNEAVRVLRPGGIIVTVIGDGQIDYTRIPLGAITIEFGRDLGLGLEERMFHQLNNNTGQTQSRKMKGQHVAVFRKVES